MGSSSRYGPRERMVFSAAQLIRREGVAATGLRQVVAHAEAPRGSLQHYFPGGKEQLVNEAVAWAARYAARRVERFVAAMGGSPTPGGLFAAMVRQWTDELESDGTLAGCPVAAATVDCASADSTRAAVAAAFAEWTRPLTVALTDMGVPEPRAPSLATLMLSTLEGAILISRAENSPRALLTAATELAPLLDAATGTQWASGPSRLPPDSADQ
ncbi:TetR/AcrR family transcriptional regulator [Streptomyces albiaxialis]|uniref:TetR/AcrR family transcriptional regulator n=1 Tax=Streptomyces albiaxialis TaxID=329523 RepID=A0ABN2WLL8_9ACTN